MSNPVSLSAAALAAIDREIAKYPADRAQSAVMAALTIIQDERGWISTEMMTLIAERLGIAPMQVYEVATFYSMYERAPVGRHKICVCTNVSCLLCGSAQVMSHLEQRLGIRPGETTADGRVTLKEVECLGACGGAPMMQVNKDYHENLTPERIDAILDALE